MSIIGYFTSYYGNIKELNDFLNDFDYGFVINGKKEYKDFSKYKTLSTNEFLKYKIGVCWDYADYYFKILKNQFKLNPIYLYFEKAKDRNINNLETHTTVIFKQEENYVWIESSWKKYKGIHYYYTKDQAIKDIFDKFTTDKKDACATQVNYNLNKYHLTPNEFLTYLSKNSRYILGDKKYFDEFLK